MINVSSASPFRWPLWRGLTLSACLSLVVAGAGGGQEPEGWTQTQADDFTRYELQAPESQSFRILYDTSATTPGARLFFNTIRPGSEPTVHGVTDLSTGAALRWQLVDGKQAAADGWRDAREEMRYIRVELPRAVPSLEIGEQSISPAAGEVRLRIDKTYRDPESYRSEGETIHFERSLGIRRNEIVLPPGYTVASVNTPVQADTESDGRLRLSFQSAWPGPTLFEVTARRVRPVREAPAESKAIPVASAPEESMPSGIGVPQVPENLAQPGAIRPAPGSARAQPAARVGHTFPSRASHDREIVYELLDPATHSFRLYHDYTEKRAGMDRYLNVVRPGSRASDPEAWDLDSGQRLEVETLRGAEIIRRGIDIGEKPGPRSEVVLITYPPVPEGGSRRLRIEETYTDPSRYGLEPGAESSTPVLLWDRSFGRSRNAVVLPPGWRLLTSSIPGTILTLEDGRLRLDFTNDRGDNLAVLVRAVRDEAQQP